MNLNIIKGRSGVGKTEKLLSYINKNEENLIITTEPSILYIERMMAEKNIPVNVISYNTIARFVLKELNITFGTEIDKETQIIMIGKIIKENKDLLQTFKNVKYSNTSLNKIYNFIVECKEEGITTEQLRYAYESSSNVLREKLHDIVIILEKFNEALLEKNLVTSEDLMMLAIKSLKECEEFTYKNIIIDTLDSYPEYLKNIIKALLDKTENISIAFRQTSPKAFDYYICKESMDAADEIIECAMNVKYCTINQMELTRDKDESNGINIIEKELFNNDTETKSNSSNIILHEASTMYKEIDFVTSQIKSLLINKKVKPEDIIITSSAIDRYINIISTSLNKHNINYFYYKNNQLSKSYLYNFIELSLKFINKEISVENLLSIAQYPYLNLSKEEVITMDSFFTRFGYNYNVALKNGEKYDNANFIRVKNTIDKIMSNIIRLEFDINSETTAKNYMISIMNYLDSFKIKESMQQEFVELSKEKNITEANKIKSIWNGFVKLLNQIYNIFEEEDLSFEEFVVIINKMAEDTLLSTVQQYYGQVSIIDLKQAQNKKSKVLFVIGCNESYFPERTPNQIIEDHERKSFNALLNTKLKLTKDFDVKKQAAIFSTLTMPSNQLYISWSLNDLDAKPLKYASIITNIVKTFESNIVKEKEFYDNDKEEAFLEFLNELAIYKNTGYESESLSSKYMEFITDKQYSERLYNALQTAIVDKRKINSKNVMDAYKEKDFIAVTRIEKFNQCPFKHYIDYALTPERIKFFDETAADKGNYFHDVMKRFFNYVIKNNIDLQSLTESDFDNVINPIIEEVGKNHNDSIFDSTNKFIFESYKIKEKIRISAWQAIKQLKLGSFNVAKNEYAVGKEIPLDIILNSGKIVHIIGIIDRLDIYDNKDEKIVRIVDYKSGNTSYSEDLLNAGIQLQLPLYAKAVSNDFQVGGMYYFHIANPILDADDKNDTIDKKFQLSGPTLNNNPVIYANDYNLSDPSYASKVISVDTTSKGEFSKKSKLLDEKQINETLDKSVEIAKETINKILDGETKAYPFKYKDNDSCKYCQYRSICHFDSTIKNSSRGYTKQTTEEQ
jgi:ATP-dependent helicase/nuclease subunit B